MSVQNTLLVSAEETDVFEELRTPHLNRLGFVRGPTPEAQWHLLLCEAWHKSNFPVNESVRDYLAFMLLRFSKRPQIFEELSAFRFFEFVLGIQGVDATSMQDVADISLLYVAFFPERSTHRREPRSLRYSAEIGTTLYERLARDAEGKDDWFSKAYREMKSSFGLAVLVLRSAIPRFVAKESIAEAERYRGSLLALSDLDATRQKGIEAKFASMHGRDAVVSRLTH